MFILNCLVNGVAISTKGVDLVKYKIVAGASTKTNSVDIPGADGAYRVRTNYSTASIKLTISVKGESPQAVHEKVRIFTTWLAQLSYTGEDFRVVFTDDNTVFRYASYDSTDEYYVTRGADSCVTSLNVDLFCADPFEYDISEQQATAQMQSGANLVVNNTGMYTDYKILVNADVSTGESQATSLGHSNLDSGVVASGIEIKLNGVSMYYDGGISHGQQLEIDTKKCTVKIDSESAIENWRGYMTNLEYGNNIFEVSNSEGQPMNVTVEYYRRWM